MKSRSTFAVFVLVAACSSSDTEEESPEKQCLEMRDHLVDLRLDEASNVDAEEHKVALSAALGPTFVENCTRSAPKQQVRCVLEAKDASAAALCSQSR